jgi:hypothetical protein
MSEWMPWYDSKEAKSSRGSLNDFGIYQIRMVNSSGKPLQIERFCAVDAEGLIYFGRSGFRRQKTNRTIANRIREFLQQQHSGGITYARVKPLLDRHSRFGGHHLQIRGQFLPDSDIQKAEAALLNDYLSSYGELPPCNSSQPQAAAAQDA